MSEPRRFRRRLHQWLRLLGLRVARPHNTCWHYFDFPPRTAFESTLLRVFSCLRGLSFIQVGANDGRRADPLAPFIDVGAWSGLMLEPLSCHFTALQNLYGMNPRIALRMAAVDATTGRRLIYDLRPTAIELPDWAGGLASFDRARVVTAAREFGLDDSAVTAHEIETITWDEVWRQFGPRPCDLLVLDTEGYDITLLRLASIEVHRPRVIHFEHACVSLTERFTFYRELVTFGYELATHGGDTTAWMSTAP